MARKLCKMGVLLEASGEKFTSKVQSTVGCEGIWPKKCVGFNEFFSLVVKMSSIRVVLGMATIMDLKVEQMNVKSTFLHSDLEEEIYMLQPEGFGVKGKENFVCKLKKTLYDLK